MTVLAIRAAQRELQTHRKPTTPTPSRTVGCTARGGPQKKPRRGGAKSTMWAAERRRKRNPHRDNTTERLHSTARLEAGTNCDVTTNSDCCGSPTAQRQGPPGISRYSSALMAPRSAFDHEPQGRTNAASRRPAPLADENFGASVAYSNTIAVTRLTLMQSVINEYFRTVRMNDVLAPLAPERRSEIPVIRGNAIVSLGHV